MEDELKIVYDKVYSRLQNELKYIEDKYMEKSKEEIINNAYELAIKQEIVNCFESCDYDIVDYKILLEENNILDFLYKDWMHSDYGIHQPIEENLQEYLYELEDNYEKFERDPNSDLIKDMMVTLKELKNYDLTTSIDKANQTLLNKDFEYNKYGLQRMLNSKNGAKDLMEFFNEIKDNKQLEYLKEIQVINSESIDKIKDEYIPKLNEIINKNKNKSKDMER